MEEPNFLWLLAVCPAGYFIDDNGKFDQTFLGSYNIVVVALFGMLVFPCLPKETQEQRQGFAELFKKHMNAKKVSTDSN